MRGRPDFMKWVASRALKVARNVHHGSFWYCTYLKIWEKSVRRE